MQVDFQFISYKREPCRESKFLMSCWKFFEFSKSVLRFVRSSEQFNYFKIRFSVSLVSLDWLLGQPSPARRKINSINKAHLWSLNQ